MDSVTPTQLWEATSSDNGATWTAWALLDTAAGTIAHLAATIAPVSGDALVTIAVGATVYTKRHAGGGWGPLIAWSNSVASLTGLALFHWQDWNVVLTGTELTTTHPRVWTAIFGDGNNQTVNTWSTLQTLVGASSGSALSFQRPFAERNDTPRISFVERLSGTGAYDRLLLTNLPGVIQYNRSLWREPQPFNYASLEGAALVRDPALTAAWLTSPSRVWRAPIPSATGQDLTQDIVAALAVERANDNGQATLDLDNSSAKYASPGAGSLADLKLGSFLRLRPGYATAAGNETPTEPIGFWIEALTHITEEGKALLRLQAVDAWGLLERWRSPRLRTWTGLSVKQLFEIIVALAGLEPNVDNASAPATDLQPAFAIAPGESGATAIRRLLTLVRDRVRVRGDALYLRAPTVLATEYSYKNAAGQHPILQSSFTQNAWDANHALVYARGAYGESLDFTQIDNATTRPQVRTTRTLTTEAQADQLAQDLLRVAELQSRGDSITVPVTPALEVGDTIDATEPKAGLTAALFKAQGIRLTCKRARRWTYTHTLTLGPN